jgi:hypothetical protein
VLISSCKHRLHQGGCGLCKPSRRTSCAWERGHRAHCLRQFTTDGQTLHKNVYILNINNCVMWRQQKTTCSAGWKNGWCWFVVREKHCYFTETVRLINSSEQGPTMVCSMFLDLEETSTRYFFCPLKQNKY